MESKTVMMINPAIMTTSIPLYMKIQIVRLQRAVEMSRFGNWKKYWFLTDKHITVIITIYR